MAKKKIIYIINPRSGVGRKSAIEKEIKEKTDKNEIEYEIIKTTKRGHATEIAEAYRNKVDAVVAVGGDGTVNEVGKGLLNSETALGIIPCGSGNGLARELEIPLRPTSAISIINETVTKKIDTLAVGENEVSLNVAGIGFDAYISHLFATKKRRGPLQYGNLIIKEYVNYAAQNYVLDIENNIYNRNAFLISFANSSQWGNDIHIAPNAQLDDGEMDVCIVNEFPDIAVPSIVASLLAQSIDSNKYDEMIRTKHITINNTEEIMGHVDGEPIMIAPYTTISVRPKSLKVIVPSEEYFEFMRFNVTKMRTQLLNTVKDPINEIKKQLKDIDLPKGFK